MKRMARFCWLVAIYILNATCFASVETFALGATPSALLINGEVRPIAQYPKDGTRLKDLNCSHVFWLSSRSYR